MKPIILFMACIALSSICLAQKQGIRGQVLWVSGNQMPGPGKPLSPQQGIVREVLVYNAALQQDVTLAGGFYTDVRTILVAKIVSEADGSFKVKLPPGRYSVFVKEDKGLFANLLDDNGCINCVTVLPKKYSWTTITVDYLAAY